jgi:predicted ester cyclase
MGGTDMVQSATETVARRWHQEIYLRGRLDVAEEICSLGLVAHGTGVAPDAPTGPRFVREDAAGMREAFNILAITDDDVIVCGDRVAIRWAFRAAHVGPFLGVEGTGRQVNVTGMDIFRFEGDRIAEFWTEFTLMDLAEQIGAIPIAVGA